METYILSDDGSVPNHPRYPLVIYHDAFVGKNEAPGPAEVVRTFGSNDWHGAWVNGIFAYHHYHATSHEVLANVGPAVSVQFGGASGPVLTFKTGMAVAIPAGCGHCRLSQPAGLQIVGAYPKGQENWDLKRADNPADYACAKAEIAQVARPKCDPIAGPEGPLLEHWV
ncbi:MAG: cupin [Rhizobiales bacterium]|nr:cupin [Hyphomicrobiales bacterium]